MRFGLDVAAQRMEWDEVVRRSQFAEDLDFDGVWGFDHFQPMYGEGPGECFDGMTTLAALAGVTSRIRLGLLVAGATYRHPSIFTAQAITIDHAWPPRAFHRSGVVRTRAQGARHFVPRHGRPF
jgi:alkanesulfonate monooxygenase SsuD/methylene tetrahydromethanopterin reductase-like flavin-dependent oxidoreductase (luciferase family)